METAHPVQSLRGEGTALLGSRTGHPGHLAENAGSTAAPTRSRRRRPTDHPSSSAAKGGVLSDGVGAVVVPSARRLTEMGRGGAGGRSIAGCCGDRIAPLPCPNPALPAPFRSETTHLVQLC